MSDSKSPADGAATATSSKASESVASTSAEALDYVKITEEPLESELQVLAAVG
jgi:hypothetical protein